MAEEKYWTDEKTGNRYKNTLYHCPDCDAIISRRARTCPYCGRKFPSLLQILFGIALIVIASVIAYNSAFRIGAGIR